MSNDKRLLEKLLESIDLIKKFTKHGKAKFLNDPMAQAAVERKLQIIGDAVKALSEELRSENRQVDWSEWAKSRDKITHDYFNVDVEKLWLAAQNDLPPFRKEIDEIRQHLLYKPGRNVKPPELREKIQEFEVRESVRTRIKKKRRGKKERDK